MAGRLLILFLPHLVDGLHSLADSKTSFSSCPRTELTSLLFDYSFILSSRAWRPQSRVQACHGSSGSLLPAPSFFSQWWLLVLTATTTTGSSTPKDDTHSRRSGSAQAGSARPTRLAC